MIQNRFKDKNVAILGLGIEGLALADYFLGNVKSLTILEKMTEESLLEKTSTELKDEIIEVLNNKKIKKIFGESYDTNLCEYDVVFRSPSYYFNNPNLVNAASNGVEISSQMNLFFELCPAKIIGVTGTKGKGTTASLIKAIMDQAKIEQGSRNSIFIAGNIGYPAITLIPKIHKNDLVILELSNFQLSDLKYSPHVAVITNLKIDHLNYHKSIKEYHMAKFNILKFQTEEDCAILNNDSTYNDNLLSQVKSSKRYFSSESNADAIVSHIDGENRVILDPQKRNIEIITEKETSLYGKHNLENIAAAALTADAFGVSIDSIKSAVRDFKGMHHRTELIAEIDGVSYINDSFATNPEPTIAAINSFVEDKILILGGSSKGSDFADLTDLIASKNIKLIILIGDEAENIKKSLLNSGYQGKIEDADGDMDHVVAIARKAALPGDVVIMSPACASFGLFKNYKHRGNKFREAVEKING